MKFLCSRKTLREKQVEQEEFIFNLKLKLYKRGDPFSRSWAKINSVYE